MQGQIQEERQTLFEDLFPKGTQRHMFLGVLQKLLIVIYTHFLITWIFLQIFHGAPIAHVYFYGLPMNIMMAKSWRQIYHVGRIYDQLEVAFFLFLWFVMIGITYYFWNLGCKVEEETFHQIREYLGIILGVGGDNGFQALFMAFVFLLLCLWAFVASCVWMQGKTRNG